jgi:2-C-methyl-D-erythritol 4-phosphate cytidylyltransferase
MPDFALILPAAGASRRFGRSKLFENLGDAPVLVHALRAFAQRRDVTHIIIPALNHDALVSVLRQWDLGEKVKLCRGGANRAQSVSNALCELPETVEWVAVHDAARPLVTQALIERVFAAAAEHGAAAPALPVSLTIKQARGPLPAVVDRTVPRNELWALQTPQAMRRRDLLDAFDHCPVLLGEVTDDLQLLEMLGKEVWLVPGDERNIKITTQMDLKLAGLLLRDGG